MKGFAEDGEIGHLQSEFPGFCAEELPLHSDNVANIDILKKFVPLPAQEVIAQRKLNLSLAITNIKKGHLTYRTLGHNATSQ